jgi:hypothetical protein
VSLIDGLNATVTTNYNVANGAVAFFYTLEKFVASAWQIYDSGNVYGENPFVLSPIQRPFIGTGNSFRMTLQGSGLLESNKWDFIIPDSEGGSSE